MTASHRPCPRSAPATGTRAGTGTAEGRPRRRRRPQGQGGWAGGSEGLRSAPRLPLLPAHPRAAPGARPPYRELSGPGPTRTSAAPAPDAWAPRQRRQRGRARPRHVPGRARRCSRLSTHLGPARPLPPAPLPLRPRSRRRRRLLFAERGLPGPSGYGRRRR